MTETVDYTCKKCGGKVDVNPENNPNPECCDEPMEKSVDLDSCQTSFTAEHSRLDSDDEPCDDGRSGNI